MSSKPYSYEAGSDEIPTLDECRESMEHAKLEELLELVSAMQRHMLVKAMAYGKSEQTNKLLRLVGKLGRTVAEASHDLSIKLSELKYTCTK